MHIFLEAFMDNIKSSRHMMKTEIEDNCMSIHCIIFLNLLTKLQNNEINSESNFVITSPNPLWGKSLIYFFLLYLWFGLTID